MFSSQELMVLISMGFSFLLLLAIGGIVLLFPVARRLGSFMEEWIKLRRDGALDQNQLTDVRSDLRDMRQLLETIDSRLDLLGERQDFVESLIESGERKRLGEPEFG
jgi:hypothetical protein